MTRYLLSTHAFVCFSAGYVVFLDLKRNRYLALDRSEADAAGSLICGWPALCDDSRSSRDTACSNIVNSLLDAALITQDDGVGKEVRLARVRRATASLPPMRPSLSAL